MHVHVLVEPRGERGRERDRIGECVLVCRGCHNNVLCVLCASVCMATVTKADAASSKLW